jgi:hypothetical protein
MEWLERVEGWLKDWGLPERVIRYGLVPIVLLFLYGGIFGVLHELGIHNEWSHSITLVLLLAVPWAVFAPYVFRKRVSKLIALNVVAILLSCLLPFLWIVYGYHHLSTPLFLSALILFTAVMTSYSSPLVLKRLIRPIWIATGLLQAYGTLLIAATTLSIPTFIEWMQLPSVTAYGRVGVLIAQFEFDPAGQMQAGVISELARQFGDNAALHKVIDLKQLSKPISRKANDPFGEERLKEAIDIGRENNAAIVVLGIATLSPERRLDLVVVTVNPELIERQNWDIAIDTGQLEFGAKLIRFLATVIGGQTYLVLQDCATAESFFRRAEQESDLGPQTKALLSKVQLWQGHSILCDAAAGRASPSQMLDAVRAYDHATDTDDNEVRILAKIGVGRTYRILSGFENVQMNLQHSIDAYNDAIKYITSDTKRLVSVREPDLASRTRNSLMS